MSLDIAASRLSCIETIHWDVLECPHRESTEALISVIMDDNVVLLKNRLIKDVNGLCSNCNVASCSFQINDACLVGK